MDKGLELTINGETFLATRHNTAMFTFVGELACYDHIFVLSDEETNSGAYLFKNQQVWQDLVNFVVENEFPLHLNLPDVAECDVDAFNGTFYADLQSTNTFPQEWTKDGKA